jgi:hypothetical protein
MAALNGREPARTSTPFEPNVTSVKRLLTAEQVGERWQVPAAHVHRLSREGVLPSVAIGRYRRFAPAAIDAFEQAGGSETDA